jgi:Cdc6-like AAA superfamily ATPase
MIAGEGTVVVPGRLLLDIARALPEPVVSEAGDASPLDALRSCLNLPTRDAWLRCLAWLLAALRPSGPFPILILQGPPGSGKTFVALDARPFRS